MSTSLESKDLYKVYKNISIIEILKLYDYLKKSKISFKFIE